MKELTQKARQLRLKMVQVCARNGGHIASALSCIDIMVALYYGDVLKFNPQNPAWHDRDRFILSKGHGEIALYAILADCGYFPREWLETRYRRGDFFLGGHPDIHIPGVEATTGALGHGLSIAAGISLASKMDARTHLQFVLLGDAECAEGSIWEAAIFASKHSLENLIAIVDRNHLGAMDFTENFIALEPFADKWKACGWEVSIVNGHDLQQLQEAFKYGRTRHDNRPLVIIAQTTKGKGISFIENDPTWHTRTLSSDEEIQRALKELERTYDGNL